MNAKEFLMQYRQAAEKIKMLETEIEALETAASGGAIQADGLPHGTATKDKLGDMASAAADKQKELVYLYNEAMQAKWQVVGVIAKIPNAEYIAVLRGRYVQEPQASWQELGDALGCSERQAQRIHGNALQEVQRILS